jgi:F-type H+-transporting ATPase subunit gamma
LARQHVAHVLVRAFAASQAAENAARLAAMEAAERNVDDRLAELRHAAAQERQNAVTEELLDVQAAFRATEAGAR